MAQMLCAHHEVRPVTPHSSRLLVLLLLLLLQGADNCGGGVASAAADSPLSAESSLELVEFLALRDSLCAPMLWLTASRNCIGV